MVTTAADSGPGSLRDAVSNAASGDTITFNLTLPATIILTTGAIHVVSNITIAGPGADQLTISGNSSSAILQVDSFAQTCAISGLTFAHGSTGFSGGAISNIVSAVSVSNCAFSNNSASNLGGAIANGGVLMVTGCTFDGNSAGAGGAIFSLEATTCTAMNSTFRGNSGGSIFGGGAIYSVGELTVVNCTVVGNSGGGINAALGTLNLENTIIADSTGMPDCASDSPPVVNSHNLIKDGSCSPMLTGDPKLGPLQSNGGPTQTFALLAGSPAIDAGDDSVLGPPFSLTTDQRGPGFPRKSGLRVDIGAFELQQGPSAFDTCLRDNATGNLILWNSTTGQYLFTRCSDNFTLSGTGTVALVNGIRMLTDRKPDRRISAGFITGQLTGNAIIYLNTGQGIWQLFRINDTNPSAVCKC
jgi:predicted outer membrane repeat protein